MIIISNASTLIYLAKVNRLHLLKDLFKKVIIPMEVYEEVIIRGIKDGFLMQELLRTLLKTDGLKLLSHLRILK